LRDFYWCLVISRIFGKLLLGGLIFGYFFGVIYLILLEGKLGTGLGKNHSLDPLR